MNDQLKFTLLALADGFLYGDVTRAESELKLKEVLDGVSDIAFKEACSFFNDLITMNDVMHGQDILMTPSDKVSLASKIMQSIENDNATENHFNEKYVAKDDEESEQKTNIVDLFSVKHNETISSNVGIQEPQNEASVVFSQQVFTEIKDTKSIEVDDCSTIRSRETDTTIHKQGVFHMLAACFAVFSVTMGSWFYFINTNSNLKQSVAVNDTQAITPYTNVLQTSFEKNGLPTTNSGEFNVNFNGTTSVHNVNATVHTPLNENELIDAREQYNAQVKQIQPYMLRHASADSGVVGSDTSILFIESMKPEIDSK